MRTRGQRRGPVIVDNWNAWALRGLVGWWCPSATSPTGLSLLDLSGFNNTGTLTSMDAPTDWVQSGGRGALDFDGFNDYVTSIGSVSSYSFIQNTQIYSISFWMKLANATTRYIVTGNTNTSSEKGFYLIFENGVGLGTKAISMQIARGLGGGAVNLGAFFRSPDNSITDTNWHHVAITQNGSTNNAAIYVDGISLAITVIASTVLSSGDSTRVLTIGSESAGFILPFGGQLDDVRIYNRALNAGEIQRLYAGGRGFGLLNSIRRYPVASTGNRRRRVLLTAGA